MGSQAVTWNDVAMPRPKTGETPKRNIRIPDAVWTGAMERAKSEGRSVTAVINAQLARYTATPPPGAEARDPWDVVNLIIREQLDGKVGPETDLTIAVEAASDLLRALGAVAERRDPEAGAE